MTKLVADVGGTNTRVALAENGAILADSLRHYINADYIHFNAILDEFLLTHPSLPGSACVSVAGPATTPRMRLTNHNWVLDTTEISSAIGGAPVRFVNDLNALARALPHVTAADVVGVLESAAGMSGPKLVVGLGTGVNVATASADAPPFFGSAEFGHTYLNGPIAAMLAGRLGAGAARFVEVEDVFSGRGLSAMDAALHRHTPRPPEAIFADLYSGETEATLMLFATLFGLQLRDLGYTYLPLGGIYLAGGVARALIDAGYGPLLCTALQQPATRGPDLSAIGVSLLRDDTAALIGCANT